MKPVTDIENPDELLAIAAAPVKYGGQIDIGMYEALRTVIAALVKRARAAGPVEKKRIAKEILEKRAELEGMRKCSVCGKNVSRGGLQNAIRKKREVRCRAHCKRQESSDPQIYLCAHCRAPLSGEKLTRARSASKKGLGVYCKAPICQEVYRLKLKRRKAKQVACAICGQPATKSSGSLARRGLSSGYCKIHQYGRTIGHCRKGHPQTKKNVYVYPARGRECRICALERARAKKGGKNGNPTDSK